MGSSSTPSNAMAFGTDRATAQTMWDEEAKTSKAPQPFSLQSSSPAPLTPGQRLDQQRQAAITASRPSAQQTLSNQQAAQARLEAANARRQQTQQTLNNEAAQRNNQLGLSQQRDGMLVAQQGERLALFEQEQQRQAAQQPADLTPSPAPPSDPPAAPPVATAPPAPPVDVPAPIAAPAPAPAPVPAPAPAAPAPAAPSVPVAAPAAPAPTTAPPDVTQELARQAELARAANSTASPIPGVAPGQVALSDANARQQEAAAQFAADQQRQRLANPAPESSQLLSAQQRAQLSEVNRLQQDFARRYGNDQMAMRRDPRYAVFQRLQASTQSALAQAQAQAVWNEEASRRSQAMQERVAEQDRTRAIVSGRRVRGRSIGGRRV